MSIGWRGTPGGGLGELGDDDDGIMINDRNYEDPCYREFTLVSPNTVIIPTFIGTNLATKPYMPLNEVVRKLKRPRGHVAWYYLRC